MVLSSSPAYVPVTDITGLPTNAIIESPLTLTGTVEPINASYQNIKWDVVNAGTTGASISGNILTTSAAGTATVSATIEVEFATVSIGYSHTVAISTTGTLWTWGYNLFGQLGLGDTTNRGSPEQVGTKDNWVSVACGDYHTMAINEDGELWVWGQNINGQLGLGHTTSPVTTPTKVAVASDWVSAAGGEHYTMAINEDGELWAWGYNLYGQLGDGTYTQRDTPARVGAATDWVQVSCGMNHTMAINEDGELFAWGGNAYGQQGRGTTTFSVASPTKVGTDTWEYVSAGGYYTMAIKDDGTLWAWGQNTTGKLGDGTTTQSNSPVQVETANDWVYVAAGDFHTVAMNADGELWAWGRNNEGQLGLGYTSVPITTPVRAGSATDWTDVSIGGYYIVAINEDGELWSWGDNTYGRLGLGDTTNRSSPTRVVVVEFTKTFDIAVTEAVLEIWYDVLITDGNLSVSPDRVSHGTDPAIITIAAAPGYGLPTGIRSVTVGVTVLDASDYDYDPLTGMLIINVFIDGIVEIDADAVLETTSSVTAGEESKGTSWFWYLLPMLILLLMLGAGYWWWIAAAWRRTVNVTKIYGEEAMIHGSDRAYTHSEYKFTISGLSSGIVMYQVGKEGEWNFIEPDAEGVHTIPEGVVTDHLTIELK